MTFSNQIENREFIRMYYGLGISMLRSGEQRGISWDFFGELAQIRVPTSFVSAFGKVVESHPITTRCLSNEIE